MMDKAGYISEQNNLSVIFSVNLPTITQTYSCLERDDFHGCESRMR